MLTPSSDSSLSEEVSDQARASFASWEADRPGLTSCDTETTGVAFWDVPFCVTFAWRGAEGIQGHYFDLSVEEHRGWTETILKETPELVFHNAKFDLQKLYLEGILAIPDVGWERLHDTEALAHLQDEHRKKGLKFLAKELLGEDTDEAEVLKAAKMVVKKQLGLRTLSEIGYHMLPREVVIPYAVKDAVFTLQLFEKLAPQIFAVPDLARMYELERKLTLTLLRMEIAGMALDTTYVDKTTVELASKALVREMDIRDYVGIEEFNPNSPKQVLEAFEALGISLEATNKAMLGSMDHPLAEALLELRYLRKMHGTYFTALQEEQREGIIHASMRQHGTRTGRMSSGEYQEG